MKNAKHFGIAVRQRRLDIGMKQGELASGMKIAQSFLSELERGKRTWTEPLMHSAAQVLSGGGDIITAIDLFIIAQSVTEAAAAA